MALIKCPDCGKDVSDRAKACIHCGCPINVEMESKCIIKATDSYSLFEWGSGSCEIGVYDDTETEIASLRTGTTVSFPVEKEIEICVRYKKLWRTAKWGQEYPERIRLKLASNKVKIIPNKVTYLQISYVQAGILLQPKLHLSEVGMIDSE